MESMMLHNLIAGHEAKYPTLARALLNVEPAINPRVEWAVEVKPFDVDDRIETWTNSCEIIQTVFEAGSSWDTAIHEHLEAIEAALRDGRGTPSKPQPGERYAQRKIAGVTTLLGRDLAPFDEMKLRPLRDTRIDLNIHAPAAAPKNRILSELTVQVTPRRPERVLVGVL